MSIENQSLIPPKVGRLAKYDDYRVRFLIDRKFPTLRRISNAPPPPSTARDPVTPRIPPMVADGSLAQYERDLQTLPPEKLAQLFLNELTKATAEAKAAEVLRLKLQEKKLYGSWAPADFAHWMVLPIWGADEAISLSLGKEPTERFSWTYLSSLVEISEFARIYRKRRELVMRAIEAGDLPARMRPHQFSEWAREKNIAAAPQIFASVQAAEPTVKAQATTPREQSAISATHSIEVEDHERVASGPANEAADSHFDPLPIHGIARIFRLATDESENIAAWVRRGRRAKSNGLEVARVSTGSGREKSLYDPPLVAKWLVKKGLIEQARANRLLANNLPERSAYLREYYLSN